MENTPQNQKQIKSPWVSQQLLLLKTKKETGAYFYLILTLLAVSFFGFFALRPAISTITNLQKQLSDSQNVLTALQTKISVLHSLSGQYASLTPNLPLVYEAIPTSSEIPTLTRQIETLSQENNVELTQFSTSSIESYPLSTANKLYGYSFSIVVIGDSISINSFLNNITSFSRILSIQKITTGKIQDGKQNLALSGVAYFETK